MRSRATPAAAAWASVPAIILTLAIRAAYAQEDCFHGEIHTEPQTISGFLVRFQQATTELEEPGCRVEVYSLKGGMVFHAEDVGLNLRQPTGKDINGDGSPDLVLEGYSGGAHCCWTYWILSLAPRPELLATLKNQSPIAFVTGAEGKTDIQTLDGAFDYFDCLSHAESPVPTVFLRLQGRRFKDAGPEHIDSYDTQIRDARHNLSSARLAQLRTTRDSESMCSGDARSVMADALIIVLAYLYSGRQEQAWKSLDELWPAFDRQRMRALILQKRKEGVLRYTTISPGKRTRHPARRTG